MRKAYSEEGMHLVHYKCLVGGDFEHWFVAHDQCTNQLEQRNLEWEVERRNNCN